MGEQSPGIGGAQASNFRARGHQKEISSEEIKRQRGTRGGQGGCTGDRGKKNMAPPSRIGRGLARWLRPSGGVSGVRLMETAEGGRDPWTGETWGQKEPRHRSRMTRGVNRTGEVRYGSREELLGRLAWEGSADERWRPAGGIAV